MEGRKGTEGNKPCHVPRLSRPLVIGTETVEPNREAFVCETLSFPQIFREINPHEGHVTYESLYASRSKTLGRWVRGVARKQAHSGPSSVCSQLRSSGTILSSAMSMSAARKLSTAGAERGG